ncbi:MAG: PilZ domain-containing protein [Chromatiales bacterium]|nr:PilZ domain-containing protein [Chromatiales bacterium]
MSHPFTDVLVYEDHLPLSWTLCSSPQAQIEQVNQRNERLLMVLHASEESHKEVLEENPEQMAAIIRLEAKLDLLTDLVTELIRSGQEGANSYPVKLSAVGIEWYCENVELQAGQVVLLSLYLDTRMAQPLTLLAEVLSVTAEAEGMAVLCLFKGVSPPVTDLLEKSVFRCHRRQVASLKSRS